jgi:hypothetical protein
MLGYAFVTEFFKPVYIHISVFALGVMWPRFGPNIRLTTLVWDTGKFHSFYFFSHPFTRYLPIFIDSLADADLVSWDAGPGVSLTPGSQIWDPGWVKNQDPDPG